MHLEVELVDLRAIHRRVHGIGGARQRGGLGGEPTRRLRGQAWVGVQFTIFQY